MKEGNQLASRKDITSAMPEVGGIEDISDNRESAALTRTNEPVVELVVAKHKLLIKSIRRMVGQDGTGVICYCTLNEMRRLEHQWMNLQCKNDECRLLKYIIIMTPNIV